MKKIRNVYYEGDVGVVGSAFAGCSRITARSCDGNEKLFRQTTGSRPGRHRGYTVASKLLSLFRFLAKFDVDMSEMMVVKRDENLLIISLFYKAFNVG